MRWSNVHSYQDVTGYNFQIILNFSEDRFCHKLANTADPDEMPQYAAFHQGLHCLSKYSFLKESKGFKYENSWTSLHEDVSVIY